MQSSSFRFARSACTTFLISTSFLSIAEGSSSRPSCCFNYLYPLHNSSQGSELESRFTDPCTRQEIRSSSTRTRTNPHIQKVHPIRGNPLLHQRTRCHCRSPKRSSLRNRRARKRDIRWCGCRCKWCRQNSLCTGTGSAASLFAISGVWH